jgi:hypothetical protein
LLTTTLYFSFRTSFVYNDSKYSVLPKPNRVRPYCDAFVRYIFLGFPFSGIRRYVTGSGISDITKEHVLIFVISPSMERP